MGIQEVPTVVKLWHVKFLSLLVLVRTTFESAHAKDVLKCLCRRFHAPLVCGQHCQVRNSWQLRSHTHTHTHTHTQAHTSKHTHTYTHTGWVGRGLLGVLRHTG